MTVPLWGENNYTIYSDVFSVPVGKVCILFAAGLSRERVKVSSGDFSDKQAICVRRLLFAPDIVFSETVTCDWVMSATSATKIVDEQIQLSGCCWVLTKENNIGIITVPGVYRLELNDATAVGKVQVYAELVDVGAIHPRAPQELFF